jgi:hypothetical protein
LPSSVSILAEGHEDGLNHILKALHGGGRSLPGSGQINILESIEYRELSRFSTRTRSNLRNARKSNPDSYLSFRISNTLE